MIFDNLKLIRVFIVGLILVFGIKPASAVGQKTVSFALGIQGYCPVSIYKDDKDQLAENKWIRGDIKYLALYDDVVYFCASADKRQAFLADPGKYVPAYNGKCTVCKVEEDLDVLGSVQHTYRYNNRLYLFPGQASKQMFVDNPEKYLDVCTGANHRCVVTKKLKGEDIEGQPVYAASHRAKLYYFSSREYLVEFEKDPYRFLE